MRTNRLTVLALALFITAPGVPASDQLPGRPQEGMILLTGGDVYTVSGEVIPGGQVLFDKGKIVAVGKELALPELAGASSTANGSDAPSSSVKRIDVTGKRVYPGLFAVGTDLGLTEIASVRGTIDTAETGTLNPNARAEVAVNPDSELIPVARANGVLLNLTVPEGGMLAGSSAVMQLDGWTWEDLTLKAPVAIHLNWPRSASARSRRFSQAPTSDQPEQRDQQFKAIEQAFADARAYLAAKKAAASQSSNGTSRKVDFDARWEAMIPLLEGQIPLVIAAEEVRQIQQAVAFANREKVKLILFGGYDAPLVADLLKKHDIPVIVNGTQRLPQRADAPYDEPFTLPNRLREAGVRYCLTLSSRHGGADVRNLPYHAGMAAAYGLPPEEALKSITLYPAQILGVADRVGSLAPGRDATLIVADGDVLETPTHIHLAFVQGRQVDLTSKHTDLWNKYRRKYHPTAAQPPAGNGRSAGAR